MRVSCGKERMRAIAATRSSCGRARPLKKRASPRRRVTSRWWTTLKVAPGRPVVLLLFAARAGHHLLEAAELVFLHEHGVLVAGVAPRAHVVAVVAETFLDD